MRVLFCSQAAHTGGGVEAWLEALSSALDRRGFDVVTALASGRFHDPERYMTRHHVIHPTVVDGSQGFQETRIANLVRLFERVRPDVIIPVHLHDALVAAAYWKTRGGQPRIAVCIHGQDAGRVAQVRELAPFIDLAVSVSRRVTSELQPIFGDDNRVRHIPTGVPAPLNLPTTRDRLQRLGYVGRLDHTEKRVLDLVPLMRALQGSGVTLHIAGSGPEELRLREETADLPVEFHGHRSRTELYESVYPLLDALIVFSGTEAGPIVAWEAMTHAAVPVVSDFVGRAEEGVIRDGETGVVFPVGDMTTAASKILPLTRSGALSSLSLRARTELPAAYHLPAFEQAWCDALEACVAMPSRAGSAHDLPPLVSNGRLSSLGLSVETMARIRRLTRGRFVHQDPGSEWPS
ncbi:MAG TPA: glycosyltransferase [Thermoanaerobaculia bacterium]|jgi:glycosyltransferase involved in cell wall biosynthesis|nr:glycosyltransferase [Thermoanaerobaculia bacterium]